MHRFDCLLFLTIFTNCSLFEDISYKLKNSLFFWKNKQTCESVKDIPKTGRTHHIYILCTKSIYHWKNQFFVTCIQIFNFNKIGNSSPVGTESSQYASKETGLTVQVLLLICQKIVLCANLVF